LGGRGRRISEFKASLVYRVSSRTARAAQRKTNKTKQNKTKQTKKAKSFIKCKYKGDPIRFNGAARIILEANTSMKMKLTQNIWQKRKRQLPVGYKTQNLGSFIV
jgi:ABC-type nickel/cobalt efflux system permease component RcnA